MARSMVQAPPRRGVELVHFSDDEAANPAPGVARTVELAEVDGYLHDLLAERQSQLSRLGRHDWQGAELPAVVVMIDDLRWHPSMHLVPSSVVSVLRAGRALDVHLVAAWQTWGPTDRAMIPLEMKPYLTALIHLTGEQPGRGTWERCGLAQRYSAVHTDICVPPLESLST
ncbi:MAG: hypothetical protein K0U78_20165 [Actinomycetia bacterium]|nr:hypothetical protein [Actinomycetes bacterium]